MTRRRTSKMSIYSLDSIVSKCVHRPIVSKDPDKLPLYKRNDGKFDIVDGKQTRSDIWLSTVQKVYSSPNNVRRVFVTYKGVWVEYYRPIAGMNKDTLKFYDYSKVNDKFRPMEILRKGQEGVISGTGFRAIKGQWTCSNIEEIWFDWTLLLSETLDELNLRGILGAWTSKGTTQSDNGRVLKALFDRYCLKDGGELRNIFPRLKVIGYCSELDTALNVYRRKTGEDSAEDFIKSWADNNIIKQAIKSPNAFVSIYRFPYTDDLGMKYTTRSFYNFDVEVLQPYFTKMKDKVGNYLAAKRKGERVVENKTGGDFRELLIKTEQAAGLNTAISTAKMILETDVKNRDRNIKCLTDEEKKKYLKGVNYND